MSRHFRPSIISIISILDRNDKYGNKSKEQKRTLHPLFSAHDNELKIISVNETRRSTANVHSIFYFTV